MKMKIVCDKRVSLCAKYESTLMHGNKILESQEVSEEEGKILPQANILCSLLSIIS